MRTASALSSWWGTACCFIWAFLRQTAAGIWCGLRNAVTWPQRKAAALSIDEWARLRGGEGTSRRGLGEDGEQAPPCDHRDAVPVDLLAAKERVAWWCEACGTQLAADFTPPVPAAPGGGGDREAEAVLRMINDTLRKLSATSGGGSGPAVALYCEESAVPVGSAATGSTSRRHWHTSSASCASCAGSDASGSRWCLCGQCTAAAAASVMRPAG